MQSRTVTLNVYQWNLVDIAIDWAKNRCAVHGYRNELQKYAEVQGEILHQLGSEGRGEYFDQQLRDAKRIQGDPYGG